MEGKLFEYIEKNFEKPSTLLYGFILIIFILVPLNLLLGDLISKIWLRYFIYLFIFIIWVIYWLKRRNWLPKNPKNRVGLIICINTENDKQKNRLKNDFVNRLNVLIDKHNLTHIIEVIFLNEKQSERVSKILTGYQKFQKNQISNPNTLKNSNKQYLDFQKLKKRINGHFYVWGNLKERKDQENKFFFNLDALVIHNPLNRNVYVSFKNEFQNIWVRSFEFQEKVEFKGFLISADLTFLAVEYIVGLASLYSGNVFIAIELHTKVEKSLSEFKELTPNMKNVEKTLKTLIPQEYYLISRVYFLKNNLLETEKYLRLVFEREPNNYSGLLLKSIIEFSSYNNPIKSLKTVNQAKKYSNNDGTWRYNQGFLLMNMEKFKEALGVYKILSESSFINEINVLKDVIHFNIELIKSNPNYLQSYFILGYLYYKKLKNIPESYHYFESFREKIKDDKFEFLVKHVDSYLSELNQLMELD